jgi:hypothetical protein
MAMPVRGFGNQADVGEEGKERTKLVLAIMTNVETRHSLHFLEYITEGQTLNSSGHVVTPLCSTSKVAGDFNTLLFQYTHSLTSLLPASHGELWRGLIVYAILCLPFWSPSSRRNWQHALLLLLLLVMPIMRAISSRCVLFLQRLEKNWYKDTPPSHLNL